MRGVELGRVTDGECCCVCGWMTRDRDSVGGRGEIRRWGKEGRTEGREEGVAVLARGAEVEEEPRERQLGPEGGGEEEEAEEGAVLCFVCVWGGGG